MEYNTQRQKLIVPEYGRSIQIMTEHLLTIEDREKRSRMAKALIGIMGQLHPEVKDTYDNRQKYWDHLHFITDFKLDVDGPFPVPSRDNLTKTPQPVVYVKENIPFRHYGKNILRVIETVSAMEDGEEKNNLTKSIANHLKKSYLTWNRDSVADEIIAENLLRLSKGQLVLSDTARLQDTNDILARQRPKKKQNGKPRSKNSKNKRPSIK
jgi:hypothetical protein